MAFILRIICGIILKRNYNNNFKMIKKFKKINTKNKGALLLELLIVVSLLGIIIFIGTDAVFLSMKSSEASRERDVGSTLANESLEAVRSIVEENWQNIYVLEKGSVHYYTTQTNNKWVILPVAGVPANETVTFNNKSYTRYVTINNVSRDNATGSILDEYSASFDDPSTQKVSVVVISPEGYNTTISGYFFRWKNKICNQATWATGGSGNTVTNCSNASTYDTKDEKIDIVDGTLKLK